MTHPDFRALCANLTAALNDWQCETSDDRYTELIRKARAALAAPQQGAPSDEELTLTYAYAVARAVGGRRGPYSSEDAEAAQLAGLRAVLTRYGTTHPAPVAVAERLPGKEDLDPNAYCWLWDGNSWERSNTILVLPEGRCVDTHWLPHWALPLPEAQP